MHSAADANTLGPALQVWLTVKGFLCCTLLNSLGATWTALIVAASFGLALLLLDFIWIGR